MPPCGPRVCHMRTWWWVLSSLHPEAWTQKAAVCLCVGRWFIFVFVSADTGRVILPAGQGWVVNRLGSAASVVNTGPLFISSPHALKIITAWQDRSLFDCHWSLSVLDREQLCVGQIDIPGFWTGLSVQLLNLIVISPLVVAKHWKELLILPQSTSYSRERYTTTLVPVSQMTVSCCRKAFPLKHNYTTLRHFMNSFPT